jgi:hypothetical protein
MRGSRPAQTTAQQPAIGDLLEMLDFNHDRGDDEELS